MNNQKKGMIYITITALMLSFGWLFSIFGLRALRAVVVYMTGAVSDLILLQQTLAVDFIAILIGIHGILLLHSEKK